MLEVKNLDVRYKDQKVLGNFNLKIKNGEILGLLGKNGAGKTTFFETLFQNVKFSGEMLWNGQELKREQIAYLETENYFYPYITGKEYLSYFTEIHNLKNAHIIEIFKLPLHKFVQDYSSGMKKKLALIGMLLLGKPINILDEPFNGVDFEGVHILYEIIKNLKSESKVVIVSSHIIETLFHTCDKIAILQQGRIEKIYEKYEYEELKNFKF